MNDKIDEYSLGWTDSVKNIWSRPDNVDATNNNGVEQNLNSVNSFTSNLSGGPCGKGWFFQEFILNSMVNGTFFGISCFEYC